MRDSAVTAGDRTERSLRGKVVRYLNTEQGGNYLPDLELCLVPNSTQPRGCAFYLLS